MTNIILLDSVDSTNNYAKLLTGIQAATVIRAVRQTGGRGRGGNNFYSDHDGGLWVSVVSPIADISQHFAHNRAVSLAAAESLKRIDANAPVNIKWPNDVYWGDRKIAGILLENMPNDPNALIIGLGLNVNIPAADFPAELRERATSVLIETGRTQPLDDLLEDILTRYVKYCGSNDQAAVHKLYSDNLYRKGRPAAVDNNEGIFAGVEIDGRLRLDTERGRTLILSGTLRFTDDDA